MQATAAVLSFIYTCFHLFAYVASLFCLCPITFIYILIGQGFANEEAVAACTRTFVGELSTEITGRFHSKMAILIPVNVIYSSAQRDTSDSI